jgi:sterol desaturase/sphingolipid hydroxylase (fatty acid hydroxylase superfamily)
MSPAVQATSGFSPSLIFGHRSQKVFRRSFSADLFYYFLNGILPKLMLIVPLTALSAGLHRLVPLAFYSSVAALPLWLRLAAAIVANEIGGYWGHRWSHQVPFLWRFHVVHHSAEEMDWLAWRSLWETGSISSPWLSPP